MPRSAFRLPENFWRSLIAVVSGNAIYFSLERYLPPRAQHHFQTIDWGLAVDFWVCLVIYGLISSFRRNHDRPGSHQ